MTDKQFDRALRRIIVITARWIAITFDDDLAAC